MNSLSTQILNNTQHEHFLNHGYVVVPNAIPAERVEQWQNLAWQRLNYNREDSSTWLKERVHLSPSRAVNLEDFAPRAFDAIGEVCGGSERLQQPLFWADVFVCNLAEGATRAWEPPSAQSEGWHKDGYFFRHYLDSPEQGLLVIAAWTDVVHQGGGTFIAPDSVSVVARYLAKHPEGVAADRFGELISQCSEFEEITANAGDIVILHPFMLHAVSQNTLRRPRFITNPIVMLREPMNFNRADGDYSLVEAAILRALNVDSLDFQPRGSRESKVPDWVVRAQDELRESAPDRVMNLTKMK